MPGGRRSHSASSVLIYTALGDTDRVFDALYRLADRNDFMADLYPAEPELASLRDDPAVPSVPLCSRTKCLIVSQAPSDPPVMRANALILSIDHAYASRDGLDDARGKCLWCFISRRAFLFVLRAFGLARPARQRFRPRLEPCSFGRFPQLLIECRQDDLLADRFLPCQS